MRLKDKRVFITGAGGGIGRATAVKCAAEGAAVICCDISAPAAEAAAAGILAGGRQSRAGHRRPHAMKPPARPCSRKARRPSAASTFCSTMPASAPGDDSGPVETPLSVWNATIAANLTSVFLCCKAGIPYLLEAGGGVIINNASIVALVGSAFPQIAYTAAKGGVLSMTRELAVMYARKKIRAVAVCPGPIATPLVQAFMADEEAWALAPPIHADGPARPARRNRQSRGVSGLR